MKISMTINKLQELKNHIIIKILNHQNIFTIPQQQAK